MAIAQIQKIHIIGSQQVKEAVLDYLGEKGIVEIIKTTHNEDKIIEDRDLLEVSSAVQFLDSLQPQKTLFKTKRVIHKKDWQDLINNYDYKRVIKEISSLREKQNKIIQEKKKAIAEYNTFSPYRNLDVSLDKLLSLKGIAFFVGRIKKKNFSSVLQRLKEKKVSYFLEKLSEDKNFIFFIVIFPARDSITVEDILHNNDFEKVTYSCPELPVDSYLDLQKEKQKNLDKEIGEISRQLSLYLQEKSNLEIIFDYLYNLNKVMLASQALSLTRKTFILEGWIKKSDALKLKDDLEKQFPVAVYLGMPSSQEDVPVALENKVIFSPFEVVTQLYGTPNYKGVDPSTFLSLFFLLSFSLSLGDAGYGLILAAFSFFMLKKFRLSENARKFIKLFLWAGIFTLLSGLFTGSFFGNLIDKLPVSFANLKKIKDALIILDPLKEPLKFLVIVLLFGYLQICFGIFLRLIKLIKDKSYFDAIFGQFPVLVLQLGLFLLILCFAHILSFSFIKIILGGLAFCGLMIIIYQFYVQPDLSLKIFWSIYGIYSIVAGNFLADTLSFSRIFALGLTSGLLAIAINEIVFIMFNLFTGLKIPLLLSAFFAILLFILGHLMNLAINILGAYVHTSRLQYLEYFSKFFEAGGRPFRPFRKEYLYIDIEN